MILWKYIDIIALFELFARRRQPECLDVKHYSRTRRFHQSRRASCGVHALQAMTIRLPRREQPHAAKLCKNSSFILLRNNAFSRQPFLITAQYFWCVLFGLSGIVISSFPSGTGVPIHGIAGGFQTQIFGDLLSGTGLPAELQKRCGCGFYGDRFFLCTAFTSTVSPSDF